VDPVIKPLPKATERLRNAFLRAAHDLIRAVAASCPGEHWPRQHRDGRPPWCEACGRDRFGFLVAEEAPRRMAPDDLERRHAELQAERRNVEIELVAIEDALRAAGRSRVRGRPRKPPTHTPEDAEKAHKAWISGERDQWTVDGHNQWIRERRHMARAAGRR
jgi:hypothetical protein